MPTVHQFEPEARAEYHAAIRYYATEAELGTASTIQRQPAFGA